VSLDLDDDTDEAGVSGRSWYYTTTTGVEVRHPNAYKRVAKSAELIYHGSSRVCRRRAEVGAGPHLTAAPGPRDVPRASPPPEITRDPTPKPFALCQVACVRGVWAYRVKSRHTTSRAAINQAAFPAAFGGGLWMVLDTRTREWVSSLDGRPGTPEMPPAGVEMVEVPA
jgi:hypothetical protein